MTSRVGLKTSKLQYRMYADGTIIDQRTGSVAGYVTGQIDIDEIWSMSGTVKQKYLKKFIYEKTN